MKTAGPELRASCLLSMWQNEVGSSLVLTLLVRLLVLLAFSLLSLSWFLRCVFLHDILL